MLEDDRYCPDIIKQTGVVQGTSDGVNALILENHLYTYATTAIRSDNMAERKRVIGELLQLFRSRPYTSWSHNVEPP